MVERLVWDQEVAGSNPVSPTNSIMKIFLFRHGEIENPSKILPGRLPGFPLSLSGKIEVARKAKELKNQKIQKIYTSPIQRAVESAEIIADTISLKRNKIEVRPEIIEADVMGWQGKPLDEYRQKAEHRQVDYWKTTDVEGIKESGERMLKLLQEIAQNNENAVVVSHGDPIMGAEALINGHNQNINALYIKKGQYLTVVIENGQWRVVR